MPTQTRSMLLNVGPSHPAMHGVIRLIMELDGEKIKIQGRGFFQKFGHCL